jgi:hypothetical protein
VKVAFVVGFFSPVEDALRSEMKERMDAKSVVCVPKKSSQYPFDLNPFKWLLSQELNGPDDEGNPRCGFRPARRGEIQS